MARAPSRPDAARTLFGPLLEARATRSGYRVTAWDSEQGLSLVLASPTRSVLIELEARDEARDCLTRTARFNVCARSQLGTDGSLTEEERGLVLGVVRNVRAREGLLVIDDRPGPTRAEVREITVDRMLVPEGRGRYYANPYAGCMVGCPFCYVAPRAELSRRLVGAPPPRWGHWVDVKTNAREVLEREVRDHPPGLVRMSPILTDPYQPVEKRFRITRACLEVMLAADFTPLVLTREARATEDLPLLRGRRAAVGYSIPTDDDRVRAIFEPGADPIDDRVAALRAFAEAGVTTCVVVQPVLPMDVDRFLSLVAPHTRVVRVDRLHFGEAFADHFRRAGAPTEPGWVDETIARLEAGFRAAGALVDEADDLAGVVERLLG